MGNEIYDEMSPGNKIASIFVDFLDPSEIPKTKKFPEQSRRRDFYRPIFIRIFHDLQKDIVEQGDEKYYFIKNCI